MCKIIAKTFVITDKQKDMKRILLSLLTIVALSFAGKAQLTMLVADGTQTSEHVPIYGYWADNYLRCQTIYPAGMVEDMAGRSILGVKYFLESPAEESLNGTFQIRIGTATQASFSNTTYLNSNDFTTVYTGSINVTGPECSITFTTPYEYGGGNLVIEVAQTTRSNYSEVSFYGISHSGASLYGYSSSSWTSVSGSTDNFIPKTEFSITEGEVTCPTPTMALPTVDGLNATISWTENGTATQYAIYLDGVLTEIVNNQTSYTFTDLTPNTTYMAKVRAICAPGDSSYNISRSFTTPCGTEALPFNEGFESYPAGYNNFPDCWTNISGGTNNYTYSGNAASGGKSLRTSGGGTVATPPLATNGRPIEVIFSAKREGTSSGGFQVGFTSDPVNMTDIQWGSTLSPSDNDYHVYEQEFNSTGTSATGYVVFKQTGSSSSWYYWIDDIYVGPQSNCLRPQEITVHSVSRTGAGIGWTLPSGFAPDAYRFEYRKVGTSTWTSQTVTEPYIFLTGLTMGTEYEARVMSVCGAETSRDRSITFRTPACDVQIGDGSTSSTYVPFNGYYSYGYTQSVYPASAVGNIDTIYGVAFNSSSANSNPFTLDVYIGTTTQSSVSTSQYVPLSSLTQVVQNRSVTIGQGWNIINFTTPYVYNGSGNVVVAVDNNTGSYYSSLNFTHHAGSSCYWYQDGSDISPSAPQATSSNTLSTAPDIQFLISCAEANCRPPLVVPEVTGSHEVAIHIEPMTDESSWTVEYKLLSDQAWTMENTNVTTTDYLITDLAAGVDYQFRVTANCGSNDQSTEVRAFTYCDLFDVTYTEDFSSGKINTCWAVSQASMLYPSVVSGVLYTGPDDNSWIILPEFAEPLQNLMITLKAQHSSETGNLTIGVTNGQNIASFEELNTFDYTTEMTDIEDYFDVYTGSGTNIAIKLNSGNSNIDNIVVSLSPYCRKPNNIRVVEAEATTATIEWDANENATGAVVRYRRNDGSWNTITVEGNSATLTNLVANSRYEVIVRAICGDGETSDNSKTFTFRTACIDGSVNATESYPYIEDFENGIFCWQQEFESGELEWVTQRGDGESNMGAHGIDNAYQGRFNAVLYNLLVYNAGPKTRLISPLINTEPLAEPYLKYAYALTSYRAPQSGQSFTDEMSVYYRLNATSPWIQLRTYNTATTDWVRDSVELPQASTTFQISFLGYFKGGNGVAIDDVRVYTLGHDTRIDDQPTYTGIDDIESNPFYVFVYPNPANGSTTVQIDGADGALTVTVMDMSGRALKSEQVYCNSGCTHRVDLNGLAQGAYFVRVTGDKVNSVSKLIVR